MVAADCAIDFFAGPSEIAIVSTSGDPAWIAADLIAQAEHDPDARAILFTPSRALALAVAGELARQMPGAGPAAEALERNGGIIVTASEDEAIALSQRMAPEHLVCDSDAAAARLTRAGTVFVGRHSAQACGDYVTGSNHVLPTSGAAAARGGLSAADFVRVSTRAAPDRAGSRPDRAGGGGAGPGRRAVRTRRLRQHQASGGGRPAAFPLRTEAAMTHQYEKPAGGGELRLHLNENTAGCSPKVMAVLQRLTREQAAVYPDYDSAVAAAAARLGVSSGEILLTNGLDDGIMLTALVALRDGGAADPFEAVIVQPAFDMYAACADGHGGTNRGRAAAARPRLLAAARSLPRSPRRPASCS